MTTIRSEKRVRSPAGKLIKWAFIGFNVLMATWIVGGLSTVSKMEVHSAAEHFGHSVGATIAVTSLLILWALGDLILGMLVLVTRGSKVIVEESSYGSATPSAFSGSHYDLDRVDQRILEAKARVASSPEVAKAPAAAGGFGKRGI